MANIRVKDLPNTSAPAADTDEFIIDSSSAGTRRLNYGELKTAISGDFQSGTSTYKVATLGSDNKLDPAQIPDTLSQGLNFVGVANSAGDLTSTTQGDFYVIQTAFGSYNVGDQAVYDGSAYIRVTDGTKEISEGGTGATTLDAAKTNLEIINIGSAANQVSLNGMLGDMAYQSSDGVSMASAEVETLEVTDKITGTLDVEQSSGTLTTPSSVTTLRVNNSGSASNNAAITVTSGTGGSSFVLLGDNENDDIGYIKYSNQTNALVFATAATDRWTINSTGNLVAGANLGIDFGSGATFDNYEHGDITSVTDNSGAGLSITAQMKYQVIGKSVHISGAITFPTTSNTNLTRVTLLPEQCPNSNANRGLSVSYSTTGSAFYALPVGGTNDVSFYTLSGGPLANNALSGVIIFISGNYSLN